MDTCRMVEALLDDLARVAESGPNERLPKEEQIRCSIHAAILRDFHVVCAERGYGSIDEKIRTECDLWAKSPDQAPMWLEFKRCWSAKGWINKPPEQIRNWEADLSKLRHVDRDSERYFLLVGFFDFDPLLEAATTQKGVVQNIRRFHAAQLIHRKSREFAWRRGDGIRYVGVWVWHWPSGVAVQGSAS